MSSWSVTVAGGPPGQSGCEGQRLSVIIFESGSLSALLDRASTLALSLLGLHSPVTVVGTLPDQFGENLPTLDV